MVSTLALAFLAASPAVLADTPATPNVATTAPPVAPGVTMVPTASEPGLVDFTGAPPETT